jgi:putative inorganic carbon (HCO3(-)) transporter
VDEEQGFDELSAGRIAALADDACAHGRPPRDHRRRVAQAFARRLKDRFLASLAEGRVAPLVPSPVLRNGTADGAGASIRIPRLSFRSHSSGTRSDHEPIGAALKASVPTPATLNPWTLLAGGVVVVAAAVVAGLLAPTQTREVVLLPVAIALGLAIVALAVTRFELFVAFILLARASLDAADVIWLLAQRSEQTSPSPTAALFPPLAAFFLCALISVAFSADPLDSLFEVVRFGTLIVIVAVLGRLIRDERSMRLVLLAAMASAIVPLLVAFRQVTGGGGVLTASGLDRIRGTFLHSNPFAAYLFLMITLIVSLYPHVERRWKVMLAPLAVACGAGLISTYARGAWIATVIALVVVGVLQDRRILWFLGASLIALTLAVPSIGVRLSDLTQSQKESGAPGNSLVWRLQFWKQVLGLQDNPMLGIGFKEVELAGSATKVPPHNDPIRVFVETGLLGLAAYIWLFFTLAVEARSTLRRAPPGLPRGLAVAFAASLWGLISLSLTANMITQLVILWYFMTIVVLAIARSHFPVEEAA